MAGKLEILDELADGSKAFGHAGETMTVAGNVADSLTHATINLDHVGEVSRVLTETKPAATAGAGLSKDSKSVASSFDDLLKAIDTDAPHLAIEDPAAVRRAIEAHVKDLEKANNSVKVNPLPTKTAVSSKIDEAVKPSKSADVVRPQTTETPNLAPAPKSPDAPSVHSVTAEPSVKTGAGSTIGNEGRAWGSTLMDSAAHGVGKFGGFRMAKNIVTLGFGGTLAVEGGILANEFRHKAGQLAGTEDTPMPVGTRVITSPLSNKGNQPQLSVHDWNNDLDGCHDSNQIVVDDNGNPVLNSVTHQQQVLVGNSKRPDKSGGILDWISKEFSENQIAAPIATGIIGGIVAAVGASKDGLAGTAIELLGLAAIGFALYKGYQAYTHPAQTVGHTLEHALN